MEFNCIWKSLIPASNIVFLSALLFPNRKRINFSQTFPVSYYNLGSINRYLILIASVLSGIRRDALQRRAYSNPLSLPLLQQPWPKAPLSWIPNLPLITEAQSTLPLFPGSLICPLLGVPAGFTDAPQVLGPAPSFLPWGWPTVCSHCHALCSSQQTAVLTTSSASQSCSSSPDNFLSHRAPHSAQSHLGSCRNQCLLVPTCGLQARGPSFQGEAPSLSGSSCHPGFLGPVESC